MAHYAHLGVEALSLGSVVGIRISCVLLAAALFCSRSTLLTLHPRHHQPQFRLWGVSCRAMRSAWNEIKLALEAASRLQPRSAQRAGPHQQRRGTPANRTLATLTPRQQLRSEQAQKHAGLGGGENAPGPQTDGPDTQPSQLQ
eukprot:GHVT01032934.1.p1 GENE.GHVT01032934.1~~GHVT01032934.1.p1  ORF type:complete len:143 (-),score=17.49 GHVT01032934.1:23-451(-)